MLVMFLKHGDVRLLRPTTELTVDHQGGEKVAWCFRPINAEQVQ
jgi:hypothetical protein